MFKKRHITLVLIPLLGVTLMSGCSAVQAPITGSSIAKTTTAGAIGPQTALPTTVTEQTAKSGDTVKVDYTLKLDDGTVFDSSIGKTPLEFTLGAGQVIPGFNDAVLGMMVGQSKTVRLPPELAWGAYNATLVVTADKRQMGPGLNPTVGQHLTVTHSDGTTGTVIVTAVTDTTVTVDGNPPLAGKTITFDIKLLSITPAK